MSFRWILTAALAGCLLAAARPASAYDAAADWSISSNPNGVWTYGFLNPTNNSLTVDDTAVPDWDPTSPVQAWELGGATFGAVAKNTSGSTALVHGTIQFAGNQMVLHPNNSATEAADVRFIAPSAMDVNISAAFAAADTRGTSTDVHVYLNGVDQFPGQTVSGVVGTAGVTYTSPSPIHLQVGDKVDFSVGFGGNTYSNDGTSLAATITPVPEPATLVLLGCGAVGLLWVARRQGKI